MQPFTVKFKIGTETGSDTVFASSESEAVLHAKSRGLDVLYVTSQESLINNSKKKSSNFDVAIFCEELLTLIEAGLTIKETLRTLYLKEKELSHKQTLQEITSDLEHGVPLSNALQKQSHIFSDLLIASIKATERSGNIRETFARYIEYQNNIDTIVAKIKSASIYPITILSIGSLVILFLFSYVIPKFASIIKDGSGNVSGASLVVVKIGSFVHNHITLVYANVIAIVLLIIYAVKDKSFRNKTVSIVLNTGLIKEKVKIYRRAKFSRALALLLESGIDLPRALHLSYNILSEEERNNLTSVIEEIEQGGLLSSSLDKYNLSDPITSSLVSVGEKSGSLPKMLLKSAIFHEKYFSRWIDRATKIAEPTIMVALGIIVGGILILMYTPIFDLTGSIM
ncbi:MULTISPECIES: type II secretion system F family protein [Candidatus Ichthyocystis]|uniref:type II secretion system F family protein n=1 Tax=Candidatus Ichthyocystis TaxID=2929841 RepID=UPI000B81A0AC|nr:MULTISPECIES: type II secretion system F family protein [Ichthyocystis]